MNGELDERSFGIDAAHQLAEGLVHSEIVVRPEESSLIEIPPEGPRFFLGQLHVAVARHEEHGVIPEIRIGGGDHRLLFLAHADLAAGAERAQEIRERGLVGVPVAAAGVLEARQREPAGVLNGAGAGRNGSRVDSGGRGCQDQAGHGPCREQITPMAKCHKDYMFQCLIRQLNSRGAGCELAPLPG